MSEISDEEFVRIVEDGARRDRRRRIALAFAFLAAVATCAWAGYEVGLTRGKGWRAAVIDHGCVIVCRGAGT